MGVMALLAESPTARYNAPRWLVVHLPAFRVERMGYGADDVVAVVAERRSATRIVSLTPAARQAGLVEEMTAAEARALVAGVVLEPLDEQGEADDRRALARAFEQVADRVEVGPDDTLILEVVGCVAWHGGEQALMSAARALAERFGHRCQLALTDHPLAARALATAQAQDALVPRGEGARAIAKLPFGALRPSVELAEAVRALGLHTIGAWAKLDPASVTGRYGVEGARLHRVARGLGVPAWTAPVVQDLDAETSVLPEEPLDTVEGLCVCIQEGLEVMVPRLRARDKAVAALRIRLDLEHGAPERMQLQVGRPTCRVDSLLRLLRTRLERLTLLSPVVRLSLEVTEIADPDPGELDLLDRRVATEPLPDLLARLVDVLGEAAVMRTSLHTSWRPEHSWRAHPVLARPAPPPNRDADDPVAWQEAHAWLEARPRPTRLRELAQPVRIEAEQGRPVRIRRERGWHDILRSTGPERMSGDWWMPDGGYDRTYWGIGLEEGTAWVFEERGQWFLQGWFD